MFRNNRLRRIIKSAALDHQVGFAGSA